LEVGFKGHYPVERNGVNKTLNKENPELNLEFTGNGFALAGWARSTIGDAVVEMEMSIDEGTPEKFTMPTASQSRRLELAWKYQLTEGKHTIKIKMLNPKKGLRVDVGDMLVYSSTKIENAWKTH
jgi:hypothetical protein